MGNPDDEIIPGTALRFPAWPEIVGLIAVLSPFVISVESSSVSRENGVVVSSSYSNPPALIGGLVGAIFAVVALAMLGRTARSRKLARVVAAIALLGIGGLQIARGAGAFFDPDGSSQSRARGPDRSLPLVPPPEARAPERPDPEATPPLAASGQNDEDSFIPDIEPTLRPTWTNAGAMSCRVSPDQIIASFEEAPAWIGLAGKGDRRFVVYHHQSKDAGEVGMFPVDVRGKPIGEMVHVSLPRDTRMMFAAPLGDYVLAAGKGPCPKDRSKECLNAVSLPVHGEESGVIHYELPGPFRWWSVVPGRAGKYWLASEYTRGALLARLSITDKYIPRVESFRRVAEEATAGKRELMALAAEEEAWLLLAVRGGNTVLIDEQGTRPIAITPELARNLTGFELSGGKVGIFATAPDKTPVMAELERDGTMISRPAPIRDLLRTPQPYDELYYGISFAGSSSAVDIFMTRRSLAGRSYPDQSFIISRKGPGGHTHASIGWAGTHFLALATAFHQEKWRITRVLIDCSGTAKRAGK